MAQYNISRQGADAFTRLAQQIEMSFLGIRTSSELLKKTVNSFQQELGPYHELILDIINIIETILNESEESAVLVHKLLLSSVAYIEERLSSIENRS